MSLPDKFHISWKNYIPEYTITSDVSAESAYPLTNMQNQNANELTVLDMTSDTTVEWTFSSATERAANCFAFHNHNLASDATIRLRLFSGEGQTGTTVYDSTATDVPHAIPFGSSIAGIDPAGGYFEDEGNMKTHFSLWFDTVTFKSAQIDIGCPSPTNDTLSVDKLWLGWAYAPTHGPRRDFGSELIDMSEHFRKPGGGMDTVEREAYRTLLLEFPLVVNAERHTLRNILDRAKKGGDLLITPDPNDAQSLFFEGTSIYRRTSDTGFIQTAYNINSFGLALEEN